MADQKKSIADIIEEMRRELRDDPDSDADLFAPYIAKKKKASAGQKKPRAKPKKGKKARKLRPKKPAKKKKRR